MIAAIACINLDGALGLDNKLLYNNAMDMRRFKSLSTQYYHCIMGRNTFESLPKPLENRETLIVSSTYENKKIEQPLDISTANANLCILTYEQLLYMLKLKNTSYLVCGGAKLYETMLPMCDILHLTIVYDHAKGDAYFPKLNNAEWHVSECSTMIKTPSGYTMQFVDLHRRKTLQDILHSEHTNLFKQI